MNNVAFIGETQKQSHEYYTMAVYFYRAAWHDHDLNALLPLI